MGMRVPSQAQCALSCNQDLQVSLDLSGQALITPLLIAPNADNSCPGPLTLTLYNSLGQQLPNPLTCAQIGQPITARVRHTSSGNFCDGTLEVQDALAPVLSNCGDKFIFCNADPAPEQVGMPAGSDNCTAPNDLNFSHFDQETPLSCGTFQNGQAVLKRIDRNWTASDAHGNSSSCIQKIWLKHITFSDISFPANRDNISAPALGCGADPEDLGISGEPMVNGIPVGASPECEMAVTYSDQTVQHCAPAGFTILRNWTAIDFCNGAITNRMQIIKVEDTEAPRLEALPDITVGTDGFYCTGYITLPQAIVSDNCSAVTVTPSWDYGNGYGPFSGIVEGNHVVTYTAEDACGNSSSQTMVLTVVDNSPPQAICASNLQISLTNNGVGYVNAATVNAGSYDNCSPVFLSISRDEIEYLPQVQVTCADQGDPILLTLRVTDAGGLENFCQMEVTVRDFLKPLITCPANLSLNCLQDYTNLALTGQASATDNCAMQSLVYQDVLNIQPCNIGSLTRWWIASDSASNTKSCSQVITVNTINTTTVVFPANATVSNCSSPSNLLPVATGEPVIGGQSCSPLSINYTDQVFSIAPPSCFRIFRSWKVVDHCIYNPNGGSAGIWEQVQIIDVVDHSAPELILPADIWVEADPVQCLGLVQMPDITALDCSQMLTISHDGVYSSSGNTNNAAGQYPLGVHFVTFTATDACGNSAQKTLRITVEDRSAPEAVCLPGVSVQIQPNGIASLDPMQLDGGCADFCSPQNSLIFSATPAEFNCQQLGLQWVVLQVQDTAGNMASCSTQVLVQDNLLVCGNSGLGYQVDGTIRTETGIPVNNIPVAVFSDVLLENVHTDTLGNFVFTDLPAHETFDLVPYNNANWLNGVTTYDLVLISKHIVGITALDSPYKMLAADANHSGSVTTFDIVQLRKVILGVLDSLPLNSSWRFLDASYVFPNPQNPFAEAIPEGIDLGQLNGDRTAQNFIGVKVGDVNGTVVAAEARAPIDTLPLYVPNRPFQAGETIVLPVSLEHWSDLDGLQFELNLDPEILAIEAVDFPQPAILGPSNLNVKADGSISLSWEQPNVGQQPLPGQILRLQLRALQASNVKTALQLNTGRLKPEAYRGTEAGLAALDLRFEPTQQQAFEPLTFSPNPTSGFLTILNPFGNEHVGLQIVDVQGKLIYETAGILPETIELRVLEKQLPGIYIASLKSEMHSLMGKIVLVNGD